MFPLEASPSRETFFSQRITLRPQAATSLNVSYHTVIMLMTRDIQGNMISMILYLTLYLAMEQPTTPPPTTNTSHSEELITAGPSEREKVCLMSEVHLDKQVKRV